MGYITYIGTQSPYYASLGGETLPVVTGETLYLHDNLSNTLLAKQPTLWKTPQALGSGKATLVAGTVTVSDTAVTSKSVVRLNRQSAGGTLGHLSVTLTPGASFTINSSSGTDTSTIFYEVVSY